MKKIISLLIISALTASIFSGCGNTKTAKNGKVEVVKVWTNDAHSKELITKMVSDYNNNEGKNEGIQIEYTVHGGDYAQALEMATSSGQGPDMFKIAGPLRPHVLKGNLFPINDLPNTEAFFNGYNGKLLAEVNNIGDKTYQMPFGTITIGLIYNKELFKKAGLVDQKGEALPPKTWDEVREYAKKLTDTTNKVYGIVFPIKWSDFFSSSIRDSMSASVPTTIFNCIDGKYEFGKYKPAFEWLLNMKKDNTYFPGAEGLDNDPARAQFAEGRVGMVFGASWDVGVYNEQFIAKQDWGVAPVPVMDVNNRYKQMAISAPLLAVASAVKDKNLEKISKVYQWFNSESFLTKMYENGKYIPYDNKIIEKATPNEKIKGWKDFAKLLDISYIAYASPSIKLEGETQAQVFSKMWSGLVTVEAGLADLEKRYNEALQKGINSGAIDLNLYINKNHNTKLETR